MCSKHGCAAICRSRVVSRSPVISCSRFSDSTTPDHDSYALVGRVQSLDAERGGRIPALALTAAARTDERLARLLAAVHSDIPKPIEPALLTAEVARLTGRERRRAQR